MNKEEAENLLMEVCDKTKVSPWDVYRDWATISPDELLAFAQACEKIGMEKAAEICGDLSKEKQKYMLFHESNGADDCEEAIRKAIE